MLFESKRDRLPLYKADICWSLTHFHKSIEIVYNLGIDKEVILSGKSYTLHSCDALIVMPYEIHGYPIIENSLAICAVLPVEYSDIFLNFIDNKSPSNNILRKSELTVALNGYLGILLDEKNELKRCAAIYNILGLFSTSLEFLDKPRDIANNDFVYSVIKYIDEFYYEPLSLDTLANKFGYNKFYFSEIFNKNFSENINNYINSVRISKSLELLDSSLAVSDIYHKIGFNSPQQYFTYFKKIIGMTPNEFKKFRSKQKPKQ